MHLQLFPEKINVRKEIFIVSDVLCMDALAGVQARLEGKLTGAQ